MAKDKNTSKKDQNAKTSLPPSGFKIIVREVWRDKVAFVSFCIIVAILLFTFVGSLFLNKSQVTDRPIKIELRPPIISNFKISRLWYR